MVAESNNRKKRPLFFLYLAYRNSARNSALGVFALSTNEIQYRNRERNLLEGIFMITGYSLLSVPRVFWYEYLNTLSVAYATHPYMFSMINTKQNLIINWNNCSYYFLLLHILFYELFCWIIS